MSMASEDRNTAQKANAATNGKTLYLICFASRCEFFI